MSDSLPGCLHLSPAMRLPRRRAFSLAHRGPPWHAGMGANARDDRMVNADRRGIDGEMRRQQRRPVPPGRGTRPLKNAQ